MCTFYIHACVCFGVCARRYPKLPADAAKEFEKKGFEFLQLYSGVASYFWELDINLFQVVSKFHYFAHGVLRAKDLNPKCEWTFSDVQWGGG